MSIERELKGKEHDQVVETVKQRREMVRQKTK